MAGDAAEAGVAFYEADPRAIVPMEAFRVPRSVARALRRSDFEVRVSHAFGDVVRACAKRSSGGAWLSEELIAAYIRLHDAGFAQSVECWRGDRLEGGLFGVAMGRLFTSESMFHCGSDAGSIALVATHGLLRAAGVDLWDIQVMSPHLARFGAVEIDGARYRRLLEAALADGIAPRFD